MQRHLFLPIKTSPLSTSLSHSAGGFTQSSSFSLISSFDASSVATVTLEFWAKRRSRQVTLSPESLWSTASRTNSKQTPLRARCNSLLSVWHSLTEKHKHKRIITDYKTQLVGGDAVTFPVTNCLRRGLAQMSWLAFSTASWGVKHFHKPSQAISINLEQNKGE